MTKYAQNTTVSSSSSRDEIERILARYGASKFGYGWDQNRAMIQFEADGRQIRFVLELPDRNDRSFTHTDVRKQKRSEAQIEAAYEQAVRQKWRALALVVKAKLEAVESNISTFESEFMAQIVLPDGSTVGEFMAPQIEAAYTTGQMPHFLPELTQ